MRNANFNNGATNNNNNSNNGGKFIMTKGTINSVQVFAGVVKEAFEVTYPDYDITINEVQKNNNMRLCGLTIRGNKVNIAPTVYLNGYFEQYKAGRPMADIFSAIDEVYNQSKVDMDFDVESLTDYQKVQDRICFKLVNKAKNSELLKKVPYI